MARTSLRVNAKNFAKVWSETPNTHVSVSVPGPNMLETDYLGGGTWMLFQFDDPTNTLGTKRLYDVQAVFGLGTVATSSWIKALLGDYDPNTITWNSKPEIYAGYESLVGGSTSTARADHTFTSLGTATAKTHLAKLLLNYCGGIFEPTQKSYAFELYTTLTDSSTPYIEFIYDDELSVGGQVIYKSGPTSGYRNPREAIDFAWEYEKTGDYYCAADFTQTSATFYWKENGDENYTAVGVQGNQKGITIPANTFEVGTTIQWYVQGTEAGGTTSQTPVYSFSTSAGAVSATPASPVNRLESNNEEITFTWGYASADGYPPSRYILRWREMGQTAWNELSDSQTDETSYTAAENTFPSGEIQWQVIPYNIDGIVGSGSIAAFISYGAPEAPAVNTTSVPFLTINWQSADQQAYEISVDDTVYGPYFGTEKSFTVPEYLEDGTHTVKVRVMGAFALWSQLANAIVTITNDPGEGIEISGSGDIDNHLLWETEDETKDFFVYRDGEVIGHTDQTSFWDRFVTGQHTYKVINRLPSGNYSESETLALTASPDGVFIGALSGGSWIKLEYSKEKQKDPEYKETAESFYDHLAGDQYPSVIMSGYRENNLSYSALFLQEQEIQKNAFEMLLGRAVIMKLRDGTVFIGVMDSWSKELRKLYWTIYSFTLRRIEWEDYVDDTQ